MPSKKRSDIKAIARSVGSKSTKRRKAMSKSLQAQAADFIPEREDVSLKEQAGKILSPAALISGIGQFAWDVGRDAVAIPRIGIDMMRDAVEDDFVPEYKGHEGDSLGELFVGNMQRYMPATSGLVGGVARSGKNIASVGKEVYKDTARGDLIGAAGAISSATPISAAIYEKLSDEDKDKFLAQGAGDTNYGKAMASGGILAEHLNDIGTATLIGSGIGAVAGKVATKAATRGAMGTANKAASIQQTAYGVASPFRTVNKATGATGKLSRAASKWAKDTGFDKTATGRVIAAARPERVKQRAAEATAKARAAIPMHALNQRMDRAKGLMPDQDFVPVTEYAQAGSMEWARRLDDIEKLPEGPNKDQLAAAYDSAANKYIQAADGQLSREQFDLAIAARRLRLAERSGDVALADQLLARYPAARQVIRAFDEINTGRYGLQDFAHRFALSKEGRDAQLVANPLPQGEANLAEAISAAARADTSTAGTAQLAKSMKDVQQAELSLVPAADRPAVVAGKYMDEALGEVEELARRSGNEGLAGMAAEQRAATISNANDFFANGGGIYFDEVTRALGLDEYAFLSHADVPAFMDKIAKGDFTPGIDTMPGQKGSTPSIRTKAEEHLRTENPAYNRSAEAITVRFFDQIYQNMAREIWDSLTAIGISKTIDDEQFRGILWDDWEPGRGLNSLLWEARRSRLQGMRTSLDRAIGKYLDSDQSLEAMSALSDDLRKEIGYRGRNPMSAAETREIAQRIQSELYTVMDDVIRTQEAGHGAVIRGDRIYHKLDDALKGLVDDGGYEYVLINPRDPLMRYGKEWPKRDSIQWKRGELRLVPHDVAAALDGSKGKRYGWAQHDLAKAVIDRPNMLMKTMALAFSPAWQVANIIGNVLLATFAGGVDPLLLGKHVVKNVKKYKKQSGRTRAQVKKALKEAGADRSALRGAESERQMLDFEDARLAQAGIVRVQNDAMLKLYEGPMRQYVDKLTGGRRPIEAARNRAFDWNQKVDELMRKSLKDAKMEQGYSPAAAEKEVLDALGDFGKMTPFELNVVRRVLPFYAWTRHLTLLAMRLPVHHPARTLWMLNLGQIYGNQDGLIHLWGDNYIAAKNLNPYGEVGAVLTPGGAKEALFRGLSPVPRMVLSDASNYDLSRNRPFNMPPGEEGQAPSVSRQLVNTFFGKQNNLYGGLRGYDQIARYDSGEPMFRGNKGARTYEQADASPTAALLNYAGFRLQSPETVEGIKNSKTKKAQTKKEQNRQYDKRKKMSGG